MAASVTFDTLRRDIRAGKLANVYLLHGEEGYFIDELLKDFSEILPEADREFNTYTLYAPQVEPQQIIDACRSFPMMSDRQVVILKEAQAVAARDLNKLTSYLENPSPTTLFVIAGRGATVKSTEIVKAVKKGGGVVYEAQKLKTNAIPGLVQTIAKNFGLNIELKSINMLADYIGTDASRLYNEIEKLAFILGVGMTVTPEAIERNIGISKDYNNFELIDALAVRNAEKAFKTVRYFAANPKSNPYPVTASSVFSFFSNLMIAHFTRDKSPSSLMAALGFRWPSQLKSVETGLRHYNAWQVIEIISAIRTFDVRSKGVGSRQPPYELLQDLIFNILTATGNIPS